MSSASSSSSSTSASAAASVGSKASGPKCAVHGLPLKRLCKKCEVLCCDSCADHKDHETTTVQITLTEIVETKAFAEPVKFILVMGGLKGPQGMWCDDGEVYDVAENKWAMLPAKMRKDRQLHAMVHTSAGIFTYGLTGGNGTPNTLELYDYKDKEWTLMPSGVVTRNHLTNCGVCVNGYLYAIGGWGGSEVGALKTSERYEIKTKSWTTIAATMNTARRAHCCVVGPDGQHIYAIGGSNEDDKKRDVFLRGTECFDVAKQVWEKCAPMTTGREEFAACLASDGRIYVFGGIIGRDRSMHNITATDLCECYDPIKNTWTKITSLPQWRWGHTAVATEDGKIFVIGGTIHGYAQTDHCWMYDIVQQTWTKKTPMKYDRNCMSACPFFPPPPSDE